MYRPADVEPQVADKWVASDAFHAEPGDPGDGYSIVIPPPNVTAALHMGHALNNTLQDILTRYHRMLGDNAVWLPGTDHAGIATQTVVEKRVLQEEGKRRTDFQRDAFVAKIQAWKDEYEQRITDQLKAMGCSCDWERQAFTLDEVRAKAVREAFFKLFKDGLIYRGKRLVNWDPVTQTALADDEVEMRDIDGNFYYMKYPIVDDAGLATGEYVTVATTRPETMLGDTAVAVNPSDAARAAYIGKRVKLPIVNRIVPIIADEYVVIPDEKSDDVKAKYASGFLKVTPAHDPNDYDIGQRQKLDIINVMGPDGSISKDHGWPAEDAAKAEPFLAEKLLGQDRYEARKQVVIYFKERGLMQEIRPYRHAVGHSYRSHAAIEPYLSDQWYVKVADERLAGAALKALVHDQRSPSVGCVWKQGDTFSEPVEGALEGADERSEWEGRLRFYPERYARTFQGWHENIRDWCISRQLWWGHRIPVWSAPSTVLDKTPVPTDSIGISEITFDFLTADENKKIAVNVMFGREVQGPTFAVCVPSGCEPIEAKLDAAGFTRDPDVLDTWFSSALWPLSTLGWPGQTAELEKWNPTNVLCTAREIITLWVSRMVMFNLYLRGKLPFYDVFIHAMIQDGHGQKMSKSLGNGVDPMDIIHSHGSDAMRFTLASVTTQTQDVRMPVDVICPHSGEMFTPKFVTTSSGHKVAAPIQESPKAKGKKMVSSYGLASGEVQPTAEMPLARNTSEKFDIGRNFANKLWNAVRFALSNLEAAKGAVAAADVDAAERVGLADRWILSRLARALESVDGALGRYEFANYAQNLYDFFWRDLCDWYIEAVKPTVQTHPAQQRVLAACLDVSLRLLHPVMPFITERLWEALNEVAPVRGLSGLSVPRSELLIKAPWPKATSALIDPEAEKEFELIQRVVGAIREVRTTHKVPPRQQVECSAKAPAAIAQHLLEQRLLVEALANMSGREIGPHVDRPSDAAVTMVGEVELYVHGLVDAEAEGSRLRKRAEELGQQIQMLRGRLSNENYTKKAPEHLVQQTKDQLAAAEREVEGVRQQLEMLK
jgi:valyl-tRNA synthetase